MIKTIQQEQNNNQGRMNKEKSLEVYKKAKEAAEKSLNNNKVVNLNKGIDLKKKKHKRRYENNTIVNLTKETDEEKKGYKNSIKVGVDNESTLRISGKSDYNKLAELVYQYFDKYNGRGIGIFPSDNREAYRDLMYIYEAIVEITETEFLVVADNGILHIDIVNAEIKFMKCQDINKQDIFTSVDGRRVLIERKGTHRPIISKSQLHDNELENLKWEDRNLTNKNGYQTINITISRRNINIKVQHLIMLMKYGLAVMSMAIWEGASLYVIDHINGDKRDNRIINLQLIPHRQNSAKQGKEEEHILYSDKYCYNYAPDLKAIADDVARRRYKQG